MPQYLRMNASVGICSAEEVTPIPPATSCSPEQNTEVANVSDAGSELEKEETKWQ